MTSQQFLVCDNSTVANFVAWASAISNFIRSVGWTNTADTGQLNGAGAGNWAGVTTVPGSGLTYYEIFKPGDALAPFYLKLEYGNSWSSPSTNSPTLAITVGSGTNGAGTLIGLLSSRFGTAPGNYTPPSATTPYECDFSGDSGRLSILMWRNAPNDAPQAFAIQRSLNASGSPTSTYVTIMKVGRGSSSSQMAGGCQSLNLTTGPCQLFGDFNLSGGASVGLPVPGLIASSSAANGSIAVWFLQPQVGFWDYPCTTFGFTYVGDVTEGVPFTITNQYGQTKTYMPAHNPPLNKAAGGPNAPNGNIGLCVEYD